MGQARTLLLFIFCHTGCALEISVPPSLVGILHTDTLLPCTFQVEKNPANLQFLAIFWHFGDKEIAIYDSKTKGSTSRFTIDEQAVKQNDASLTIRNVTVSDRGRYRCTVVYTPDTRKMEIQLNILAVPEVRIQKKAVQKGVINLLQCSISNFFPNDMKVIWLKNGEILRGSVTEDDKMNTDKTFTRNSAVNVTFLEEEGNPKITCQVEHQYLQDPIKDSYVAQYGAAPTVNIKASRTPDGNDQIYMCEATNYFPEAVAMHWLLDGNTIDSPQQSNNKYFNKEICYRIHLDEKDPPSRISCEVQHETLYGPLRTTEEVKVERDCKRSCHFGLIGVLVVLLIAVSSALLYFIRESQRFQVGHIHRMQTADDQVTLCCTASNCPKDVEVTWKIKEKDGEEIVISDVKEDKDEEAALIVTSDYSVETERSHSDKLHHAISNLRFTPIVSKHKEMDIFCKFKCGKRTKEKHLKCPLIFKKPEVAGPMQLSLDDNGDVLCSVSLQNFYPKDIKITWSHGVGHFQDVETLHETFTNKDFTFNVRSECRVPGPLFKNEGYRVRATWSHKAESGQQEVSIRDSKWRPVMGEIEKSAFKDGEEAKLHCRVSGYFPDALDVKWLRRDAESQELYDVSAGDKYKIPVMEATQQEEKTFTCTACLIISVSVTEDCRSEFVCRVKHPSLKTPLERRTGDLGVMGIRAVNVTNPGKDKLKTEVLHFAPKEIKITWSRQKSSLKTYEEYKDPTLIIEANSDGSYSAYSEIVVESHQLTHAEGKHYKVVVEHEGSNTRVEKNVLQERVVMGKKGRWYLVDDEDKKTPLKQTSEQQQGRNANAENWEPPADKVAAGRNHHGGLLSQEEKTGEVSHTSQNTSPVITGETP